MEPVVDPAILRLPHPIRVGLTAPDFWPAFQRMLGRDWVVLSRYLEDGKLTLAEACYRATSKHNVPNLSALVGALQDARGNTDQGGAMGLMAAVRQLVLGYTYFKLDDELVELLEQTDLDEDIPLSYLLPPFNQTYLELGSERALSTFVPNVESGLHVLEGAYVERGYHRDCGDSLYFVMTGSPIGHTDASDDATMAVLLPLTDLNASLGTALENAFHQARGAANAKGMRTMPEHMLQPVLESLILVAKALLYVSLPDTRRELRAERTALEESLKALKSSAKRAKLQRKLPRIYDYILISANAGQARPSGSKPPGDARTVKPHWRRGHYRMHRHGPELSLTKLLFIRPTLVAADQGVPEQASTKTYVVK